MKHRKRWAAVLGVATLTLAGCPAPDSFEFSAGDTLNLPTEQRPPAGSALPGSGSTSSGGSTSTGGSTPTGGETGTNPKSLDLTEPMRVDALFPQSSEVSVAISNAPKGVLAVAAPSLTAQTLSVTWSGQTGFQALQSLHSRSPGSDQEAKESALRARAARYRSSSVSQRSVQAVRTLSKGMEIPLKIDAEVSNVTAKVLHVDAGVDGRQRFAILVDQRDEALLFGDATGTTLLDNLVKQLRDPNNAGIFKTNRTLFGNDPTVAEAAALGVTLDQEETLFVFSQAVNQDTDITKDDDNGDGVIQAGEGNGVLGYYYLGDFSSSDPHSNRSKVLYLASNAAYRARTNTTALNDLGATIAHELQHLLFSWGRIKAVGMAAREAENASRADAWIDEGLAMYAMAANGYGPESNPGVANPKASINLVGHVQLFLTQAAQFSMTAFYTDAGLPPSKQQGNPEDAYGMAYLFTQYMIDQHGTDIIPKILGSTKNGIDAGEPLSPDAIDTTGIVSDALARDSGALGSLFANFAAAVALDGSQALADATDAALKTRYEITGVNLRSSPYTQIPFNGPLGLTSTPYTHKAYGVSFLKPGSLSTSSSLAFSGDSGLTARLILHR
jgi:hypothetical protein